MKIRLMESLGMRMFLRLEYILTIQWAEVLSADAFSAFEDAGLDNNKV